MGMHQQKAFARSGRPDAGHSSVTSDNDACTLDAEPQSKGIADFFWERRKYVLLFELFLVVTSGVTIRLESVPGPTRAAKSADLAELPDGSAPIVINGPLSWLMFPFGLFGTDPDSQQQSSTQAQAPAHDGGITDEE